MDTKAIRCCTVRPTPPKPVDQEFANTGVWIAYVRVIVCMVAMATSNNLCCELVALHTVIVCLECVFHSAAQQRQIDTHKSDFLRVLTLAPITLCALAMHAAARCTVSNSNQEPGTACKCAPGFNGEITWSGVTPIGACSALMCTGLASVFANGNVVKSNEDRHGSVAKFACNEGYKLTVTSPITCSAPSADAAWPTAPKNSPGSISTTVCGAWSVDIIAFLFVVY